MAWDAEPIKHFLEVTHIKDGERYFVHSQEYTLEEYSTKISLHLSKYDKELRVRPYAMEHLKQLVEEDYSRGVVNELFVGIRDGTGIAYVGKFWTSKQFHNKNIIQYFFKNNEPSGHNLGNISGPGWPLNLPPVLDERLMQYFNTLKDVRPAITDSLDNCMKHLTIAGPEYTGTTDGSLLFKF